MATFKALRTQWRHGMNGPTGLDYSAIDPVFRHLQVPPEQQSHIFADLQLMEVAALNEIRKSNG